MSADVLAAAQAWEKAGFSVIPIRPDGSKAPAVPSWQPFQQERASEAQLGAWFSRNGAGLAVIGGAVSGNLEILDFDDPDVFPEYEAACEDNGLGAVLARCPLVETPSGGRHVLYRCAEPVDGNQKLAIGAKGKPRIETRGEGGYVVAPPSGPKCHPAGKPYRFFRGRPDGIPTLSAEERRGLLGVARFFDEAPPPSEPRKATSTAASVAERPGDAYNATGDFEAELEAAGWQRARCTGPWQFWRRPGKPDRGWSAKSGEMNGHRGLYVYSSNAAPFEPFQWYTPFGVLAALRHGGDYAAAARALGGAAVRPAPGARSPAAPVTTTEDPEPDPLPWPDLAVDAYHGLAGEFVGLVGPETEADPVALLSQFLVYFGNAAGRCAYWAVEADRHHMNEFVCLVGDTAKGRKGTSEGHIRSEFRRVDSPWVQDRILSGLSSGEGLIYAVRDAVVHEEEDKYGQRITKTSDFGVDDKRLLVVESEFAGTLKVVEREGNTLSAYMRDLFDGKSVRSLTKNSPLRTTAPHVSVIAHVTSCELRQRLSETESANGFANRFLFVAVRRSHVLPFGGFVEEEALDAIAERVREAVIFARGHQRIPWGRAARPVWAKVYPVLSAGRPGLLGAVTSRAEAHTARLALLYAVLDCSPEIQPEHLYAALALWQYSADSAAYIFGDSLGDRQADELLRALRAAGDAGMSRTAIRDHFSKNLTDARSRALLETLQGSGLARSERRATGGRPSDVWFAAGRRSGRAGVDLVELARSVPIPDRHAAPAIEWEDEDQESPAPDGEELAL